MLSEKSRNRVRKADEPSLTIICSILEYPCSPFGCVILLSKSDSTIIFSLRYRALIRINMIVTSVMRQKGMSNFVVDKVSHALTGLKDQKQSVQNPILTGSE